jgi:hypothetical protein
VAHHERQKPLSGLRCRGATRVDHSIHSAAHSSEGPPSSARAATHDAQVSGEISGWVAPGSSFLGPRGRLRIEEGC